LNPHDRKDQRIFIIKKFFIFWAFSLSSFLEDSLHKVSALFGKFQISSESEIFISFSEFESVHFLNFFRKAQNFSFVSFLR